MAVGPASCMARWIVTSSLDGLALTGVKLVGRQRTIRSVEQTAQWLRYLEGHLDGLDYRLRGREPEPDVGDDVLADRVRSELGPVLRRLDLPRVNVTVEDGVAVLHGDVASGEQADEVIAAVVRVSGVLDVDAHLHIGPARGTTRPSTSREHPEPSPQLRRLREAAEAAGVEHEQAAAALRVFLLRLPAGERDHVVNHLPDDVRTTLGRVEVRTDVMHVRDVDGLVATVADVAGLSERRALRAVEAALFLVAELVPEEAADIPAVLPAEIRELWFAATTTDDE